MVKKEISKSELMYYLEEMIEMDLADEIETRFYEDCQWEDFTKMKQRKVDLKHIIHNYRTYQNQAF